MERVITKEMLNDPRSIFLNNGRLNICEMLSTVSTIDELAPKTITVRGYGVIKNVLYVFPLEEIKGINKLITNSDKDLILDFKDGQRLFLNCSDNETLDQLSLIIQKFTLLLLYDSDRTIDIDGENGKFYIGFKDIKEFTKIYNTLYIKTMGEDGELTKHKIILKSEDISSKLYEYIKTIVELYSYRYNYLTLNECCSLESSFDTISSRKIY